MAFKLVFISNVANIDAEEVRTIANAKACSKFSYKHNLGGYEVDLGSQMLELEKISLQSKEEIELYVLSSDAVDSLLELKFGGQNYHYRSFQLPEKLDAFALGIHRLMENECCLREIRNLQRECTPAMHQLGTSALGNKKEEDLHQTIGNVVNGLFYMLDSYTNILIAEFKSMTSTNWD